ncbi:MAG: MFS transporter [Clostridiales bacterium]|nr:MFS transporter [Candidatus Cacconaster stercorequi]
MTIYQSLSILVNIFIAAILVCEALLAVRSFSNRKKVMLLNPGHPELANANQFALSIGWLGSIDSIVIVTLTRKICAANGISDVFSTLPVIASSIGSVVGIEIFRPLRNHFSTRNIVGFSYLLYAISAFLCIWCARANSIAGMCMAKIIGGIAAGILNAVLFRLPSLWKDNDEGIRTVTTDTENGLLTSGILGVFAGGFLAEHVSYASIYLLEAVTAVCFFVIGRFVFIKKESRFNKPDRAQKKDMSVRAYKFIFKPAMIALLLIFVLYNGTAVYYKQIIFPLFSDDLGFSEQTISDVYILVRCLIYFCFRFIEKLMLKINNRSILMGAQIIMGVSFLIFLWLDASFLWASAMLLITGILCKLIKNHGMVLWNRELYRQQIKSYYANPPLMAITAMVSVVAPGLLSLLLSFGVKVMGAVMGLLAIGFTVLYSLTTLKYKDYLQEEEK